ncbi:MAG: hypothetical protein KDI36_02275 [Pseudomonadales bacterium]|nr:hypothetical protein [Pseudomonadales bacterium]
MDIEEAREKFSPGIEEILGHCTIEDKFVDKDMFRVYVLTVWGNAVLDPERTGIAEADLSVLHDYLNEELSKIIGPGASIAREYEFILSKPGEDSLARLSISAEHRHFLTHFAHLVLTQAR